MSLILFLHKHDRRCHGLLDSSMSVSISLSSFFWHTGTRLTGCRMGSVNIVCDSVGTTKLTLICKDVGILQEQLKELFLLFKCKVTCTVLDHLA